MEGTDPRQAEKRKLETMYSSVNCSDLELKLSSLELLGKPAYKDLCNSSNQEEGYFDPEDLNMTAEQLRMKYLGPRRSGFFIPICTMYLLIFVVGAVGNALTCLVIIQHRFMRTPTNYYLFSLAISDLLVLLLGMPLEIYEMWSNYPFLLGTGGCCFKTLLFEAVCFASILNVTALSVERYIAVVHPLKAKYVVTKNHAKRVIATVWVLSIICSIPNTSLHGIQTLYVPARGVVADSATCTLVKSRWMYNLIIQVTTIIFFFMPMGVISILYLLIGLQLRKEKMLDALEAKSGSICDYHNIRLQQKKARRSCAGGCLWDLLGSFPHRPVGLELHHPMDGPHAAHVPVCPCHLRRLLLPELCRQPHPLQPDVHALPRDVQRCDVPQALPEAAIPQAFAQQHPRHHAQHSLRAHRWGQRTAAV
ncbi:neuromedin-U receptor 1 isoform X2 [Rhineura floridana]|uniref:neuromedin-U receptor 1 isoform X2 n=1 Tax=Rhineura floridana TaxID=261503 RepID=UPI002AC7EE80|nr:neuromedin-U receptor 1 isoform X2 [Rhineura floridana]